MDQRPTLQGVDERGSAVRRLRLMNGRTRMRKISLAGLHTLVWSYWRFIAKGVVLAAVVLIATVASCSWAVSWAARAKELAPLEALSLQFGDMNGVAYYTVQGPSYRVVATLATEAGIPVRFEGSLLPGQKLVVSIPDSARAKAQTIELFRQGNRLLVEANPMEGE